MRIQVFDGAIKTSEAELSYIVDRVGSAVQRVLGMAADVRVRLSDLNGPRGGVDKRCAIQLTCPHGLSLSIDARAKTYYDAIDAAAARLRRGLTRAIERSAPRARRARPERDRRDS